MPQTCRNDSNFILSSIWRSVWTSESCQFQSQMSNSIELQFNCFFSYLQVIEEPCLEKWLVNVCFKTKKNHHGEKETLLIKQHTVTVWRFEEPLRVLRWLWVWVHCSSLGSPLGWIADKWNEAMSVSPLVYSVFYFPLSPLGLSLFSQLCDR